MARDPEVAKMVSEALKMMSPSLKEIHERLGGDDVLSYSSVRAWRSGDRTPSPKHIRRLAEIAERQASQLFKAAAKLESSAEEADSE